MAKKKSSQGFPFLIPFLLIVISVIVVVYTTHKDSFTPVKLSKFSFFSAKTQAELQAPGEMPLGEHLIYKISWLGIPVGYGEVWVKEKTKLGGRSVFHVVGTLETNTVLSAIYPIRDSAESWIDARTFESLGFEKKMAEPGIHVHEKEIYDRKTKKGSFQSLSDNAGKKEFDIQMPVHDVFSVFYWVRRQTLVPGKSIKTVITVNQKDWALTIDVIKKETMRVRGGKTIDTFLVEPRTIMEGEERRGRCWMSLTADSSHTPVRVTYKAPFGSVTGILIKSSGK